MTDVERFIVNAWKSMDDFEPLDFVSYLTGAGTMYILLTQDLEGFDLIGGAVEQAIARKFYGDE